jgi:hypothetical protein
MRSGIFLRKGLDRGVTDLPVGQARLIRFDELEKFAAVFWAERMRRDDWSKVREDGEVTTIMKTMRAKYPDVDGAFQSKGELLEKCADSERMNARDTSATILPMLPPFGIHFQKERMAF